MSRRWLALAALLYAALAVTVTWPVALRPLTTVVQRFPYPVDAGQGVWNLWWARAALLRGWNPYITNYVYYPEPIDLFYQTLSLPNAILALPVLLPLGPIAAFNFVTLLSFVLGGLLTRRLCIEAGASEVGALLGGAIFAFSAYHTQLLLVGALEVIAIHWLPLYALALLWALRRPTLWRGAILGLTLLLVTLAAQYYGLYCAVLTGLVWAVGWPGPAASWPRDVMASSSVSPVSRSRSLLVSQSRTLPTILLAALIWVGGLLLLSGAGALGTPPPNDWRSRQMFQSAALVDYVMPTVAHPLWGAPSSAALSRISPAGAETGAALGYSVWLLALCGVALARAWRWGLVALGLLLLSLGPELKLAAPTGVPLPFALLDLLGPFRNASRPNYVIGLLMLALAVLASLGLTALRQRSASRAGRGRLLSWALAAAVVFELTPAPLATLTLSSASPVPPAASADAGAGAADDAGAVLSLPPRTDDSRAMVAQLCHGRPLLGGYLARTPAYPAVEGASALRSLWLAEPRAPDIFRQDTAGELAALGVRYVVIDGEAMTGRKLRAIQALLDAPGIARIGAGDVYAVDAAAATVAAFPDGAWYAPERDGARLWRWMGERAGAQIYLRTPAAVEIAIEATAYARPRPLTIALDGVALAQIEVPPAPAALARRIIVIVPAGAHRLELISQAETAPDGRSISLSVGRLWLTPHALPGAALAPPPTLPPPPFAPCAR